MIARRLTGLIQVAIGAIIAGAPVASSAQLVDPRGDWRTISTPHFEIHFTPALEAVARRTGAQAESAFVALAELLHPPRGRIDLVLADNVDFTNGYATPVPTNRIVLYTTPPLTVRSLRYYDDWMRTVVSHELVHIFHLDRARGLWRAGQYVFGRSPWLMPNFYAPAWITEGLATHLESRLTTAGRTRAAHQRMLVRASALADEFPRLNALSLATSRYPGGDMAYGYGGLFFADLARSHGDSAVREFVEHSSGAIIPYRLNHLARRAFGESFTDAWTEWRDSIRSAEAPLDPLPMPGWRRLSTQGHLVAYPRWHGDTLLFVSASGREVPALFAADPNGALTRRARRNTVDANVPLAANRLVYAQLDYVNAYEIRSDLHVYEQGESRRLTRGARLTEPDVTPDGRIIAVQGVPGTNRLVLVSPDGSRITPITGAAPDTQWAAPRWSPDGMRIAAVRWTRGAFADIVVLDRDGNVLHQVTHDRAVDGAPDWLPRGDGLVFTSDREGASAIYLAMLPEAANGPVPLTRLSGNVLGLDHPEVSLDGSRIAATAYREGGWDLGVAPFDSSGVPAGPPIVPDTVPDRVPEPIATPSRGYSPWRTVLPRAWLPLIGETADGNASFGGAINGNDVLGRHAYSAQALFDPGDHEHEFDAAYRYRRFGQPVLTMAGSQEWGRGTIVDTAGTPVGTLHRRARFASIAASLERPRIRSHSFLTMGGEVEWRRYTTTPGPLLDALHEFYRSGPEYRSLVASTGFSNTQRPPLAISAENGIAAAVRGQLDWLRGTSGVESRSMTAVLSAYRALPFPGYAHHVLALRLAGAASGGRNPSLFEIGGTSGSAVTLLPGLVFGERRSLGVRGFDPGSLVGTRALVATAEYRAPLAMIHRGVWWLPAFLDRASITAFADAGTADGESLSESFQSDRILASAGAELALNVALQYDIPYLVRLGLAAPVRGRSLVGADAVLIYVRVGASF